MISAKKLLCVDICKKYKYFIAENGTIDFKAKLSAAAEWDQTNGLLIKDAVFPHITYGFRNQRLPIATYHVSNDQISLTQFFQCRNYSKFSESTVANSKLQ